jgi:catechol 2,3-dioxygenase-like lactoylglutathione lyase family enzyme
MTHDEFTATARLTHIGLCVADLERSLRFYIDGMGFEEIGRMFTDEPDSGKILEVDGAAVELVYLSRDGFRIELIDFRSPGVETPEARRPVNRVGLTHFAFRVDDLDAWCARIRAAGGTVLEQTASRFVTGNRGIMVVDPDGTRVELIERDPKA